MASPISTTNATGANGLNITPGSGFTGPTTEPGVVGSGRWSDAKVIARWDVVPFDVLDTTLGVYRIGLIAFHIGGIARVRFSCNGGPWTTSSKMSQNPQTKVWEYFACLKVTDFSTAQMVEIRAIVYPKVGLPRLLESLYVYVDPTGVAPQEVFVSTSGNDSTGNGTNGSPYLTISKALSVVADGGTVTLKVAGTYSCGQQSVKVSNTKWITVRAAAGLTPDQVHVIPVGGVTELRPKVARLKWKGVSFDFSAMTQIYPEGGDYAWFDGCLFTDSAGWTHEMSLYPVRDPGNGTAGIYATGSRCYDMLYGFSGFSIVRSCSMEKISGDALSSTFLVVNCTAKQVSEKPIPTFHSDLCQHFGVWDNVIIYGLKATNLIAIQALFNDHTASSFTNFAVVNYLAENNSSDPPLSQLCSAHNHVLFLHLTILGQGLELRDDFAGGEQFTANNVGFVNCVLKRLSRSSGSGLPSGVGVINCHFLEGEQHGTKASTGLVTFQDLDGGNFQYAGTGAASLIGSGAKIESYTDPAAWTLWSTSPNRGAFKIQAPIY